VSSRSIVLDSSAWIEILSSGPLSKHCTKELKVADQVFIPTLVFFEVYKKIASSLSEDRALSAVALLSQYVTANMTREVALAAADLSIQHKLAMADSLILAHAYQAGALLITLDNDFSGLPGTLVIRKT
jgi:predicted nucleic acid-binding protein